MPRSIKIFLISFCLVFIMATLPHMGFVIPTPKLITPQSATVTTLSDSIKSKLASKKDRFILAKTFNLSPPVLAADQYSSAASYLVVNYDTGEILSEKNYKTRLPVASLTKIMTSIVALDLASPGDIFTATQKDANVIPTKMEVIPGQKYTVEELLDAALLTSANDAAQMLQEGIDQRYGPGTFIQAMNQKARDIGMSGSQFSNPQGFDDGNPYSTSQDLALLTHYALTNYPIISEIVKKDYQFLPGSNDHKQADLYNWNGLLGVYPGIQGVKIGNTDLAGYTQIALSERDDKKIMTVLLGAPGILERDTWSAQLLDLGFSKFGIPAANITENQLKDKYSTWRYWQD